MVIGLNQVYASERFAATTKRIIRGKGTRRLPVCLVSQQTNNNSYIGPSDKQSQIQSVTEPWFEFKRLCNESRCPGRHLRKPEPIIETITEIHRKHRSTKSIQSMLKNNSSLPGQSMEASSDSPSAAIMDWSDDEDQRTYTLENLPVGKSGHHGDSSDNSDLASDNSMQLNMIGPDGTRELEEQDHLFESKSGCEKKHTQLYVNMVDRDQTGVSPNETNLDQTRIGDEFINSIPSACEAGHKSNQLDEACSSLAYGMPSTSLSTGIENYMISPEHASRVYSLTQLCEIKSEIATYLVMPSDSYRLVDTYALLDADDVSLEIADPKISSPTIDGDFSEETRCTQTIGESLESGGQSSKSSGKRCSRSGTNQQVVSKVIQSEDDESTTRTIPKRKKLRRKVKITLHESPVSGEQEPSSLFVRLCIDPISDTEAIQEMVYSGETNRKEVKHDVIDESNEVKIHSDALDHHSINTWVSNGHLLPVRRQPVSFRFNDRERLNGMAECLITSLSSLSLPVSEVDSVASSLSWSWSEQRLMQHSQRMPASNLITYLPPNTVLVDLQTDDDEEDEEVMVAREKEMWKPEGDYDQYMCLSQVRSDGTTQACILKADSRTAELEFPRSLTSDLHKTTGKGQPWQRQRSVKYHITQEPVIDKPSMNMADSGIATSRVLQSDQFEDQHFPVSGKEAVFSFSPSVRITFGGERKEEDPIDEHFPHGTSYTTHGAYVHHTVSGDEQYASTGEVKASICTGQYKSMACQTCSWDEIDEERVAKVDAGVGTTPVQVDSKLIQCLADYQKTSVTQNLPYFSDKKATTTVATRGSRHTTQWFVKRIKPDQASKPYTRFTTEKKTRKNAPQIRSGAVTLSEMEYIRDTIDGKSIIEPIQPRAHIPFSGPPRKSQLSSIANEPGKNEADRNSRETNNKSKLRSTTKKQTCNARSGRSLMSIAATEKSTSEEKSTSSKLTRFKLRCFGTGLSKLEPMFTENLTSSTGNTSSLTNSSIDEGEFTCDSQLPLLDLHAMSSTPTHNRQTGETKSVQCRDYSSYYYHYYYYEQDKQYAEWSWPVLSFTGLSQQLGSSEHCSPESVHRVHLLPVSTYNTLTYDMTGSTEKTSHWRVRPSCCSPTHRGLAFCPKMSTLTPIEISLVKIAHSVSHRLLYSENILLLHLWSILNCHIYVYHTHSQKFTSVSTTTTIAAASCYCYRQSTNFGDDTLLLFRLKSPTVNLYQLGSLRVEESAIVSTQLLIHSSSSYYSSCYPPQAAGLVSCLVEERQSESSPLALRANQLVRVDGPRLVDGGERECRWVTRNDAKQCWGSWVSSWQSSEITVYSDGQVLDSEKCTPTVCTLTAGTVKLVSKERAHDCVEVHNCYVYQLQPLQKHKYGLQQCGRLARLQGIGHWMRSVLQAGRRRKKKESPNVLDTHNVTVGRVAGRCSKVIRNTEVFTSVMDRHVTGVLIGGDRTQRAHLSVVNEETGRMKTVSIHAPAIRTTRNAHIRTTSRMSAYSGRYVFTVGKSGDQRNMPLISKQRSVSSNKITQGKSTPSRNCPRRVRVKPSTGSGRVRLKHYNQIPETGNAFGHAEVLVQQQSPSLYLRTYESKLAPRQRKDSVVPQGSTLEKDFRVKKIDSCKLESSTMHGFGDVSDGDQHNLSVTASNGSSSIFESRTPSTQSVDMETSVEFTPSTSTEMTSETGQTMTASETSSIGSMTSNYHESSIYGSQVEDSTLSKNLIDYATPETSVCWGEEVVKMDHPRLGQNRSSSAQTEITITEKQRRKITINTNHQNSLTRSNSMHQQHPVRVPQRRTATYTNTTTTVELTTPSFNQTRESRGLGNKANHVILVDLDITNAIGIADRRLSSHVRPGFTHSNRAV